MQASNSDLTECNGVSAILSDYYIKVYSCTLSAFHDLCS